MVDWEKLFTDPDWIESKRFDNSLRKALERYPDGAPDRVIAQCLGVSEEEIDPMYTEVVERLRDLLGVID